jgi:hypothetical protein
MLLDGNMCFFVMYHYENHTLFGMPIPGLYSESILMANNKNFE